MGIRESLPAYLENKEITVEASPYSPHFPFGKPNGRVLWKRRFRICISVMIWFNSMILEILWVEFLTQVYPDVPKIHKSEGWAAALEYLIAKMHRRAISYQEVSTRYGVTVSTVSRM